MPLGIEQDAAVQLDMAAVGPFDAGNALERHALAAAGCAEEREICAVGLQLGAERKAGETLFNVELQHQRALLLCCFSKRFTASSTTVEMAALMSTQRMASASLFVRHI